MAIEPPTRRRRAEAVTASTMHMRALWGEPQTRGRALAIAALAYLPCDGEGERPVRQRQ